MVNTPVEGVAAPMGVLLIVPPLIVRASVTCASEADPTKFAKAMLSVEVAESVYPVPLPTKSCPKEGVVVSPVPPYTTPIEVVADTTPLLACSGPLSEERVSPPLKVLRAVYVFAVKVFGMVVDPVMYESTLALV